jgi:hypothetical protein
MDKELSSFEKAIILFLATIMGIAILGILSSCRGTKTVYSYDNNWKPMPKSSSITGWNYTKK